MILEGDNNEKEKNLYCITDYTGCYHLCDPCLFLFN